MPKLIFSGILTIRDCSYIPDSAFPSNNLLWGYAFCCIKYCLLPIPPKG